MSNGLPRIGISKRIRQLKRYRTIASAFARNGLGYIFHDIGLHEKFSLFGHGKSKGIEAKSIGERIRLILEELGPTFVKLGQIASTRPDLIPPSILSELERLQDHVPAFSYREAARIIEEELGDELGRLFLEFAEEPMAAASIGQVHRAVLKDGTVVAVKVQRPGIHARIETDLDILADVARVAESRLEWAGAYRLGSMVEELGKALRSELDYTVEARNAERFDSLSKALGDVKVPKVWRDYSSRRVLTTTYMEGIKLSDKEQLIQAGINLRVLAERFTAIILHQVLIDGFFHGDPHPGNVLAQKNGSLVMLDFGMVGRLTPEAKKHFASFVIALRNQSTRGVIRAISHMGVVPEDVNKDELHLDVDALRDKYYDVPFNQISMGEAVQDLFAVALRHRIRIPAELTLLGKTLLTMEGVVLSLDPTFSVFNVAEPFGRKLLLEQINPVKKLKAWIDEVPDYVDLVQDIPIVVKELVASMRQGRLKVEVGIPQVDSLMKRMDRISNRLSFSIILLALSIVMVGLIISAALNHAQTLFWGIPIIEIGFVIALLMFLWLIFAILRSGRF
jgi:ubiquinone biosynthesis protein